MKCKKYDSIMYKFIGQPPQGVKGLKYYDKKKEEVGVDNVLSLKSVCE